MRSCGLKHSDAVLKGREHCLHRNIEVVAKQLDNVVHNLANQVAMFWIRYALELSEEVAVERRETCKISRVDKAAASRRACAKYKEGHCGNANRNVFR